VTITRCRRCFAAMTSYEVKDALDAASKQVMCCPHCDPCPPVYGEDGPYDREGYDYALYTAGISFFTMIVLLALASIRACVG
jgi:hypothetical protein